MAAAVLECVLERERIQHGREHPRVIGGGAVHAFRRRCHAAVDVSRAHDNPSLDARGLDLHDLFRNRVDRVAVHPVLAVAHERLA